jgi:phosphatidylglycerol:prolipoprotein diacylglycerol transferase
MQITNPYPRSDVRPSLLAFERLRIHSYVSMLYAGAVAGIFAGTHWAEVHGLPAPKVFLVMVLIFPAALAGARLLFVALHWSAFRRNRARIWSTSEGGAALYGGLVLSFLLSLPLLWAMRLPLGAFWDAVAIALLVGMIFTRIGCALQGCCAGRPSQSWLAFSMPDVNGIWRRRLPFPLFEAGIAALTLAFFVHFLDQRSGGMLFLGALAMYGTGRWILEPTREKVDRVSGWSVHRIISAVLAGAAAATIVILWVLPGGSAIIAR